MIDSVTSVQYSGYFQGNIRDMIMRRRVAKEAEEARVQRILEEERRRIWNVCEGKGKLVDRLI